MLGASIKLIGAPPLIGWRKNVLLQTLPPEFLDNTSPGELHNVRKTYQERDSDGNFQEFHQVLSCYIDQNIPCQLIHKR